MELKLALPSLPPPIFNSSKHFALLAQRWKLHIQRISWKGEGIRKNLFFHLVKEGETLTSILKLDAVSILANADADADKDIVDDNLVFEGHHLHIPSAIAGFAQVCHFDGNKLHKVATGVGLHGRQWNQVFTVPTPCRSSFAKTTGSFLVLVPLAAFCIRCIMAAFQHRAARNLRHQAANKSGVHLRGSNSMRWKAVLSDLRDSEALDTEFEPDSGLMLEDKEQSHFEAMSGTYNKLEDEYQKFLSECGMSKWGYWRGGSSQ